MTRAITLEKMTLNMDKHGPVIDDANRLRMVMFHRYVTSEDNPIKASCLE